MLSCIPNIRHLHLYNIDKDFPIDSGISFSSLTQLRVDVFHSVAQLHYFLKNAPKLCSLDIDAVDEDGTDQVLTHRSLRHIKVCYGGEEWFAIALGHLSFPLLETLRLPAIVGFKIENVSPLIRFLDRSDCKLIEFEAIGQGVEPFMPVLEPRAVSSSLQVFRLPGVGMEQEFFNFLLDTTKLPRLGVIAGGDATDKPICEMLHVRRRLDEQGKCVENACLERIEVDCLNLFDYSRASQEDRCTQTISFAKKCGVVLQIDDSY